jgi:hypothetical protein
VNGKQRDMLTRAALGAALTLSISARADQVVPLPPFALTVEVHGETLSFNGHRLVNLFSLKQECVESHGSFAGTTARLALDVNTPDARLNQIVAILKNSCGASQVMVSGYINRAPGRR